MAASRRMLNGFLLRTRMKRGRREEKNIMDVFQEKIAAIRQVHQAFAEIIRHDKCRTCSCLHGDMMAAILTVIRDIGKYKDAPELVAAENDFSEWIDGARRADLHH